MASGFQQRNAEVATAVAMVLGQRGFTIPKAAIGAGIESARLPGRLERMPGTVDPPVWIDGAHNEDKIAAVTSEAIRLWRGPAAGHRPRHVEQQGSHHRSSPSSRPRRRASSSRSRSFTARDRWRRTTLAGAVAASGFAGAIHVEPDPDAAVRFAEVIARSEGAAVLVTGSMYLAGQVRRRWFPDQDIVLQRTPWPTRDRRATVRSSPTVRWPCRRQSRRRARRGRRSSGICRN